MNLEDMVPKYYSNNLSGMFEVSVKTKQKPKKQNKIKQQKRKENKTKTTLYNPSLH